MSTLLLVFVSSAIVLLIFVIWSEFTYTITENEHNNNNNNKNVTSFRKRRRMIDDEARRAAVDANCLASLNVSSLVTTNWRDRITFFGFQMDTWNYMKNGHYMDDSLMQRLRRHCVANSPSSLSPSGDRCLFLDIGSHLGAYALAATEIGSVDVVAFEAQPSLACAIRLSIAANRFAHGGDKLALYHCYVAGNDRSQNDTSPIEICAAPFARGASRLKAERDTVSAYAGELTYSQCTNASVCNSLHIPRALDSYRFRFLKIDTEGHDFLIMNRHVNTLRHFDAIYAEYMGEENRPSIHNEFCETFRIFNQWFQLYWSADVTADKLLSKCEDAKGRRWTSTILCFAYGYALDDISCKELTALRNSGYRVSRSSNFELYRSLSPLDNSTNVVIRTAIPSAEQQQLRDVTGDGAISMKRLVAQRMRDLAVSRATATALQSSSYVARLHASALSCGRESAAVFEHIPNDFETFLDSLHARPALYWCRTVRLFGRFLQLVASLAEHDSSSPSSSASSYFVLCDWRAENFRLSNNDVPILIDTRSLVHAFRDAPLHGGAGCRSVPPERWSQLGAGCSGPQRCFAAQVDAVTHEQVLAEAICTSDDATCRGFDSRSNLWGVATLFRRMLGGIDVGARRSLPGFATLERLTSDLLVALPGRRMSLDDAMRVVDGVVRVESAAQCDARRRVPIDIVVGGDRKYWLGMFAMLRSAWIHAREPQRLRFHVLAQVESDEVRALTAQLDCLVRAPLRAQVHVLPFRAANLQFVGRWSSKNTLARNLSDPHNFARFALPDLLPRDVDKLLWLDADTLLRADVGELFDTTLLDDVAGADIATLPALAAAVEQRSAAWSSKFDLSPNSPLLRRLPALRACALNESDANCPHFNAGVWLARMQRWRARNTTQHFAEWAALIDANPSLFVGLTQPPMILEFFGATESLDSWWNTAFKNYKLDVGRKQIDKAKLIHFNGAAKPWYKESDVVAHESDLAIMRTLRALWQQYAVGAQCAESERARGLECSCRDVLDARTAKTTTRSSAMTIGGANDDADESRPAGSALGSAVAALGSFRSKYAKDRATGGAAVKHSGAEGSTPHCYLHPLLPDRCAPYFLCIGAQKAGTQTFLNWIQLHPQVRVAERELHFFDYGGTGRTLSDYYRDLPLVRPHRRTDDGLPIVVGEKTPRYSVEANPMTVHQAFPEMRLIFLLREPVSRAFSHFLHLRRRAAQSWRARSFPFRSFDHAIRHSLFLVNALHVCGDPLHLPEVALLACVRDHPRPVAARELLEHPADMLMRGLYGPIIRRWSEPYFPLHSQLLVVQSDDLFKKSVDTMNLITRFLNLTSHDWTSAIDSDNKKLLNQKADQASLSLSLIGQNMTDSERRLLEAFYEPYNRDLATLLGAVDSPWLYDS